jgi:hypothetical protein
MYGVIYIADVKLIQSPQFQEWGASPAFIQTLTIGGGWTQLVHIPVDVQAVFLCSNKSYRLADLASESEEPRWWFLIPQRWE